MRAALLAAASARFFVPPLRPRPAARAALQPAVQPGGTQQFAPGSPAADTAWPPAIWFFGGVFAATLARPLALAATEAAAPAAHLHDPAARDDRYGRPLNA